MPFNYFNPSDLAIGNKIRAVFHQLYQLADSAEENIEQFSAMQEFLDEYDDRNYRVARPIQPYNPCRTDEFFNVINDKPVFINKLYYDTERKRVYVDIIMFNRVSNRITRLTGNTDILEGYCVYKQASSNLHYLREPEFVEDAQGAGLLFKYRVGSDNTVIIDGSTKPLGLTPYDCSHYTKIENAGQIAGANETYTAKEYECVCVVGNTNNLSVKLNGNHIMGGYGQWNVRYCVLYLAPGDEISGSYSRILKVKYVINIPQPNKPIRYYWNKYQPGSESNTFASEDTPIGQYSPNAGVKAGKVLWPLNTAGFTFLNNFNSSWTPNTHVSTIKIAPQLGKGFYESEPEDVVRYVIKGRMLPVTIESFYNIKAEIKADISICNKDGNKIYTIPGNYVTCSSNYDDNGVVSLQYNYVSDSGQKSGSFEATIEYKKIPDEGYIAIDFYMQNITSTSEGHNYSSGMKAYITEFYSEFYKF